MSSVGRSFTVIGNTRRAFKREAKGEGRKQFTPVLYAGSLESTEEKENGHLNMHHQTLFLEIQMAEAYPSSFTVKNT